MRRRHYLRAASLAIVSLLAGCSGSDSGNDTNAPTGGTDTTISETESAATGTPTTAETTSRGEATPTEPAATSTAKPTDAVEDTTAAANTETAEATDPTATTAANESGGLPDAPGNGTPGTPAEEFTTSTAMTPMDANTFVDTLESRLDEKELMTGYVINTLADEQTVELTYVASEDNQRKRLEAFAESFVEVVARTGGTGGWSLDMTVQTGAEREV
jgi:hypothetical protein